MGHSKGRRTALKNIALATSGASLGLSALSCNNEKKEQAQENLGEEQTALKGNINHAACYWCYGDMPLDNFAQGAAELGLKFTHLYRCITVQCSVKPVGVPEFSSFDEHS